EAISLDVLPVQLRKRCKTLSNSADNGKLQTHAVLGGTNSRVGRATNGNPGWQAMFVCRLWEGRIIFECGTLGSRPGDGFFAAEELSYLVKQHVAVGQIVPEEGEGLDETAASQRDFSSASCYAIECREALMHAHRIIRGQHRDR